MASRYSIRSISMPTNSHPTTSCIDDKLSTFKTFDFSSVSTTGSICSVFDALEDLYASIDEVLSLSSTQQALVSHSHHVEDLLDNSVRILDVCGVLRDLTAQLNDSVQSLQSALRRRKGDSSIETSVAAYKNFKKKMNKEAKKLVAALKQTSCRQSADADDHRLAAVIRALNEVSAVNVSAFLSVSVFLSAPKANKRSLIAKLMQKGSVACEEKQLEKVSELESVDCALSGLCRSGEKMEGAQKRLGDLEKSVERIENGLERLFRRLIKTRTSLLNIISQ